MLARGGRTCGWPGPQLSVLGAHVGRAELGHTQAETGRLQAEIDAAKLPLPLVPMVDIDHGDVSSSDPVDSDPYAWARNLRPAPPSSTSSRAR